MGFDSVFELLPLGDVAIFINGDRSTNYPKGDDYIADGIPFISAADLSDSRIQQEHVKRISNQAYERLRSGKIQYQDILFCLRGSIGKLAYVQRNEAGAIASSLVIVRSTEKIDPRYLYYILCSQAGQQAAESLNNGSAQPNLSVGELQKVKIPLPSIAIQYEITSVLGSFDDRITLLRETNATLEAMAQALFKSWFVDFDPVHAKKVGRTPEGMDEATANLFPDDFEESELGLVPKGWGVGKIADIGEVICGKTPPTSELANYGEDIPFITIPDMHNSLVITSTNRSLSTVGANTQKKKTLPIGSVCVSCIATAGLVARVTTPSQTNQQINSVVPLAKWGNSFTLFTLRLIGDAVRAGGSGGSVFHNLNKSGFEQLKVLFPCEELALAFNGIVEPIVEKIISNQQQAQTLANLRDTLLPRLISGQLQLSELKSNLNKVTI
jgi:type I restriction enzyme S subunit